MPDEQRGSVRASNAAPGYAMGLTALAFSPDGRWLATGDRNGRVVVFGSPRFEPVSTLSNDRGATYALAFGHDAVLHESDARNNCSWLVAAAGAGGVIRIWEAATGHVKAQCLGSPYEVHDLAFDNDGTTLASGGRDQPRLWDVATGRVLLALHGIENLRSLAFSVDGKRLAACGEKLFVPGRATLWELSQSRGIQALRGLATPVDMSGGPRMDREWPRSRTIGSWGSGTYLKRIFGVSAGALADNAAADFSTDGERLAFVTGEEAQLYDMREGRLLRTWALPTGYGDSLRYVATNKLLLLRREARPGQEGKYTWRLRDLLGSDEPKLSFEGRPDRYAWDTALPRDADHFLVWGRATVGEDTNCVIQVRSLTDNRLLQSFRTALSPFDCMVHVDERGHFLAYSSERPEKTELVSIPDGRWLMSSDVPPGAISPNGELFASLARQGGSLIHRGKAGDHRFTLGIDWRVQLEPMFSPDGGRVAWGTSEGTVLVADLNEVQRRFAELKAGR